MSYKYIGKRKSSSGYEFEVYEFNRRKWDTL